MLSPTLQEGGLAQAHRIGEPLGSVLLAQRWITRRQQYVAFAEVWGTWMTFVDPVEVARSTPRPPARSYRMRRSHPPSR